MYPPELNRYSIGIGQAKRVTSLLYESAVWKYNTNKQTNRKINCL